MKRILDYLKDLLTSKDKKKMFENSIIIIIIGIIIIIAGSSFIGKGKDKKENIPAAESNEVQTLGKAISSEDRAEVEKRIESILSQIGGAGKVTVMITYISGKEIVPAYDTKKTRNNTEEKDNGGGTRNIDQDDYEEKVVFEEGQGGGKKPIVLKEIQPQVKGVVVVADGASDPQVKESLCRAVQVLVDVAVHKIQVFERNK